MKFPPHTSVLIIGAGPSGLMMAAQLLRLGIQPVIIDSKTSPVSYSQALAVQARSLEIFKQLNLAEEAVKEGIAVEKVSLHLNSDEIKTLNFTENSLNDTEFPFVLTLPQYKTERLLLNYLTSKACPVSWNTSLLSLKQTDEQVTAVLKTDEGEITISCSWLIGADGAHSSVRRNLAIPFSGGTYQNQFYLADLPAGSKMEKNAVHLFFKDRGFAAMFPMNKTSRFISVLPQSLKNKEDVGLEDVKPYLTYSLDFAVPQEHAEWFAVYRLHHRMAQRFQQQRCFLIGDAAHIHSPVGGQGMNTGIQDAYNLAWKLAGVVKNEYHPKILKTYAEERMPAAKSLLKTTDRAFTFLVSDNWFIRKFRNWLLPKVLDKISRDPDRQKRAFRLVSQIGINYRNSSLSVHHSQQAEIKAGDRLPFVSFYDEKQKEETNLHDWCGKSGFTLLIIGKMKNLSLLNIGKWIKLAYPFNLNFYYLPHSERNQHLFDLFDIKEHQKKTVIVRPDLHIGYINDNVDIESIEIYLKETIGWVKGEG